MLLLAMDGPLVSKFYLADLKLKEKKMLQKKIKQLRYEG